MKLCLVQTDIAWEDKYRNFSNLESLLMSCDQGTDIALLPEMFNTGFSVDPVGISEPPFSETFGWMKGIASDKGFAVCGSYIVSEHGKYFNRWIFISPEGRFWSYDKRHLFSPGDEDKLFSRGSSRVVFEYKGLRICPNICYDLRFPVWSRNRNDYDILMNSANWPESRRDVWITLLKARALENQCYVAGVNRIGRDGTGIKYSGDSMVFGPKGEILASAEPHSDCHIYADISQDSLNDFREKFPVWRDGDEFTIDL